MDKVQPRASQCVLQFVVAVVGLAAMGALTTLGCPSPKHASPGSTIGRSVQPAVGPVALQGESALVALEDMLSLPNLTVTTCSANGRALQLYGWGGRDGAQRNTSVVVFDDQDEVVSALVGLPPTLGRSARGSELTPDGHLLLAASSYWVDRPLPDGAFAHIVAWDVRSGAEVWRTVVPDGPTYMAISPDGRYVAVDSRDVHVASPPHRRTISLHRVADGEQLQNWSLDRGDTAYVGGGQLGWAGEQVLYSADGRAWAATEGRERPSVLATWPEDMDGGRVVAAPGRLRWAHRGDGGATLALLKDASLGDPAVEMALSEVPGDGIGGDLLWSPDGAILYYMATGSDSGRSPCLHSLSMRDGTVRELARSVWHYAPYSDGVWVLSRGAAGTGPYALERVSSRSPDWTAVSSMGSDGPPPLAR